MLRTGLSPEEFERFMRRIPSRIRAQFKEVKDEANFQQFDTNNDNIIDAQEFGVMLDKVIQRAEQTTSGLDGGRNP